MVRRRAFWDGGRTWKIRFAPPVATGRWSWRSLSSSHDTGLAGQSGEVPWETGPATEHRFYRHGLWRMSPAGRNLVHANGRPVILAGDMAWALSWPADREPSGLQRDAPALVLSVVGILRVPGEALNGGVLRLWRSN